MKRSVRARRMARHHRRNKNAPKLNLVSLMDIFTILVFFLLVNSSDVEVLTNDKTITLPASVSETVPDTTLVVKINARQIIVGGRAVAQIGELGEADEIAPLKQELDYRAGRKPLTETQQEKGRPVTIMGDKAIPYTLLKKVMNTCAESGYRDISLAVTKVSEDDGASSGAED